LTDDGYDRFMNILKHVGALAQLLSLKVWPFLLVRLIRLTTILLTSSSRSMIGM
jgi:hypothetical protein